MPMYDQYPYECPKCGFTTQVVNNMIAHFERDCEVDEHANCTELTDEIRKHVLKHRRWGNPMNYFNPWFDDESHIVHEFKRTKEGRNVAFYEYFVWEYFTCNNIRILNKNIHPCHKLGLKIFMVPVSNEMVYVFFRRENIYVNQNAILEMFIENNTSRLLGFYDLPGTLEIRDEVTGEKLHIRQIGSRV
jgi:glutaredoxin-related protein